MNNLDDHKVVSFGQTCVLTSTCVIKGELQRITVEDGKRTDQHDGKRTDSRKEDGQTMKESNESEDSSNS